MSEDKRRFETTIELPASAEEVWRALTEARELMRWFPLEARVTPGEGGSMWWSWGEAWAGQSRIEAWEPPRLLRLVTEDARPYDAEGGPLPAGRTEPARLLLELTLEGRGGTTRLRLVHSGFGRGSSWDDELDGISAGWTYELRSLRHYLAHHRGRDRHAAWANLTTAVAEQEAWKRLLGPEGFRWTGSLRESEPYEVVAPTGDRFTGAVDLHLPGSDLAGTVRELDEGLFRLWTWRGGGRTGVGVWLASYTGDGAPMRDFQTRAQAALERLFPKE